MSSICHSGHGYSKILCEDITSWFINEYFPRHKILLEVIHRGMKREKVVGLCDVEGDVYRPRHFVIELQSRMERDQYILTLMHELHHMAQWIRGDLTFAQGKLCHKRTPVDNWEYLEQPHEIEAREMEQYLYDQYLQWHSTVPVPQVSQLFPNRLCAAA